MIRLFHIHVSLALLALGVFDAAFLYAVISLAIDISRGVWESSQILTLEAVPQKGTFPATVITGLFMVGVYNREHLSDVRELAIRIVVGLALSFVMLTVIFYVVPAGRIWMSALIPAMLASGLGLLGIRQVFRSIANFDALRPRVLVLGDGPQAHRVEQLEHSSFSPRFSCIGFVPMGPISMPCVERRRIIPADDVRRACAELRIDEMIVALEEKRNTLPIETLLDCRLRGVRITPLPSFIEREVGQIDIDCVHPSWLVFSDGSSKRMLDRALKRGFDILVSVFFLIFTPPAMLAIAAAIWLEDGRPIFYRQERVCRYGRMFRILKFRSMRKDAESDGIARWAAKRDSRVTRVGAFIRKTRLDEIPQTWNVLKGEMSFVGPRPERPSFVAVIAKELPFYDCRHLVKPGITGWAQINCGYGGSVDGAREKLKYDLYYVKNCSIFLDLVILLQTARVMFWREGAR